MPAFLLLFGMSHGFFFRAEGAPSVQAFQQGHARFVAGFGSHSDAQEPHPQVVLLVFRFPCGGLDPFRLFRCADHEGRQFNQGAVLHRIARRGNAERHRIYGNQEAPSFLAVVLLDGKEGRPVCTGFFFQVFHQPVRHMDVFVPRGPVQQVLLGMKHEDQVS